jgi:hypothetical protein
MLALLLALVLVQLAGIGARDQLTVAHLVARNGQRPALLATAIATGALASLLAGLAARSSAPEFNHQLRLLVAAMALAAGGIESILVGPPRMAREPTHSLGAAAIVLFAHQITDAARMLVFAMALATSTRFAVLGAAFGGGTALAIGWFGGGWLLEARRGLRMVRACCGLALLAAAGWAAFLAVGDADRFWRLLDR